MYAVGKRKTHLKASELHISNREGYWLGQTLLLENAVESYQKWLGQLSHLIAQNIKNCESINDSNVSGTEWFKNNFKIIINIDRGTQANVDTIRNFLTYKIKQNLEMSQNETKFTNIYGIEFNFTNLFIILCQELFHLYI